MQNNEVKNKKVYLSTFGCQMNTYDTEQAHGLLEAAGFRVVSGFDEPGSGDSDNGADVVILNTCSVREHAEDRVYGRLGMLGKEKKKKPDLVVGLMGCMVEEHREKLFKRFPQLDFMIGTRNIREIADVIRNVLKDRRQVARIKQDGISIEYSSLIKRQSRYHAWLPIMTGCDKVCTFCIVPLTRGREISMPAREVYREACRLVEDGAKWITLLGQNVNSYGARGLGDVERGMEKRESSVAGEKKVCSFPELLERLCEINGLERISFTTSHPQDATEELFRVIARQPKISRRFHLPLQSGSDKILKRMKRLHTFEEYRAKIEALRRFVPDISLTTDIISGFPGETEADHRATIEAMEKIRFDGAFIYKYSARPSTPASRLKDDVPLAVKETRNQEILTLQRRIEREINEQWVGKTVTVFAESPSPKDKERLIGRTDQEKKVVFDGGPDLIGNFQTVRLTGLRHETFSGERIAAPVS